MNKNYIRGRNTEYKCMHYLKAKGYYVMRTAGSHTEFDVIGISDQHLLLVQLKRHKECPKTYRGWKAFKLKYDRKLTRLRNRMKEYLPQGAVVSMWVWIDSRGWLQIYQSDKGSHLTLITKDRTLNEWEKKVEK